MSLDAAVPGLVRSDPRGPGITRVRADGGFRYLDTEFLATGTAVRRLAAEHKLPETSPKPTFTLGLDN